MATLYLAPNSVWQMPGGGVCRNNGDAPKAVQMPDDMAEAVMANPRTAAAFVDAPAPKKKAKKKASKKKASKKKAD